MRSRIPACIILHHLWNDEVRPVPKDFLMLLRQAVGSENNDHNTSYSRIIKLINQQYPGFPVYHSLHGALNKSAAKPSSAARR